MDTKEVTCGDTHSTGGMLNKLEAQSTTINFTLVPASTVLEPQLEPPVLELALNIVHTTNAPGWQPLLPIGLAVAATVAVMTWRDGRQK